MRRSVKRRVWSRVGVMAAVAVGAIGLSLAPAGAVTSTPIGHAEAGSVCGQDLNIVQAQSTFGNYTVPAGGGLIKTWSGDSGAGTGSTLQMLLWRPVGGTTYRLVGKSTAQVLAANSGINTYSIFPPIAAQGGDILGLHATTGSFCGPLVGGQTAFVAGGAAPALDATVNFPGGPLSGSANVAASVEQGQCGPGLTAHYSMFGIGGNQALGGVWCVNAQGIGTFTGPPEAGIVPARIIRAGNLIWFQINGNNFRFSGYVNTVNGASSVVMTKPFTITYKVITFT